MNCSSEGEKGVDYGQGVPGVERKRGGGGGGGGGFGCGNNDSAMGLQPRNV